MAGADSGTDAQAYANEQLRSDCVPPLRELLGELLEEGERYERSSGRLRRRKLVLGVCRARRARPFFMSHKPPP